MATSAVAGLYSASAPAQDEDRVILTAQPTVEMVLIAVHVLHEASSCQEDRSYASKFLTAIQCSPFAWPLADQLLIAKPDINSTYFAAQTIRFKIQTCFTSELQVQQHESLRNSMIEHLNQVSSAAGAADQQQIRVIVNQLSLAVAYLVILDSTWHEPLTDVISRVTDPLVQLQILTYVPEEVVECGNPASSSAGDDVRDVRLRGVGNNRRKHVLQYLGSVSVAMIGHLKVTAAGRPERPVGRKEKVLIFRAFGSWIHVLFAGNDSFNQSALRSNMTSNERMADVRKKLTLCYDVLVSLIASLRDTAAEDDEHDSSADAMAAFLTAFFASDGVQDFALDLIAGSATITKLSEEQRLLLTATAGLVNGILSLESAFHQTTDAEEIDKSVNIIRVFAECADSSLDLLLALVATSGIGDSVIQSSPMHVQTDNEAESCKSALVSVVLRIQEFIQSHYDADVAETPFHFFHKFSDSVYSLLYKNNASAIGTGGSQAPAHYFTDAPSKVSAMTRNTSTIMEIAECKSRITVFGQHVTESLLNGLRKHSQLEPDEESVLQIESEFRDFRGRVKELLRDVVFMLGSGNLVQHLTIQFSTSSASWEEVEVDMFFIACLVQELFDRDGRSTSDDIISRVIEAVVTYASVRDINGHVASLKAGIHSQILATACDIFADLSIWLKMQAFFLRDVLSFLFHVIISSKKQPDLMIAATAALEPIIESCFAPVDQSLDRRVPDPGLQAEHLLGSEESPALISICSQLDSLGNEDSAHHLLQSAANLVSSLGQQSGTTSPEVIRMRQEDLMCKLLAPHVQHLQSILNPANDPIPDLDRIACLFRPLKLVPLPVQSATCLQLENQIHTEVWPLIQSVLQIFCTKSERTVERACRTLRYILRSVRPVRLIVPVAEVISTLFHKTNARHSCFLYVLSILVDEFVPSSQTHAANGSSGTVGMSAEDGEMIANGMLDLLQAVSNTTFQYLTLPGSRIRDHPDTIDDFFRLCTRYIQKRPEKFAGSDIYTNVLELSLHALEIEQREANHSVTRFLTEFLDSLQDRHNLTPACPPTTPSPFSSSSSASTSDSGAAAGVVELPVIERTRRQVVSQFGSRLADRILTSGLLVLPSHFLPDVADVVFQVLQLDREQAVLWFQSFFSGPAMSQKMAEVIAAAGTDQTLSTQQQVHEAYEALISARHAKPVTQNLRSLHRLFRTR